MQNPEKGRCVGSPMLNPAAGRFGWKRPERHKWKRSFSSKKDEPSEKGECAAHLRQQTAITAPQRTVRNAVRTGFPYEPCDETSQAAGRMLARRPLEPDYAPELDREAEERSIGSWDPAWAVSLEAASPGEPESVASRKWRVADMTVAGSSR